MISLSIPYAFFEKEILVTCFSSSLSLSLSLPLPLSLLLPLSPSPSLSLSLSFIPVLEDIWFTCHVKERVNHWRSVAWGAWRLVCNPHNASLDVTSVNRGELHVNSCHITLNGKQKQCYYIYILFPDHQLLKQINRCFGFPFARYVS